MVDPIGFHPRAPFPSSCVDLFQTQFKPAGLFFFLFLSFFLFFSFFSLYLTLSVMSQLQMGKPSLPSIQFLLQEAPGKCLVSPTHTHELNKA